MAYEYVGWSTDANIAGEPSKVIPSQGVMRTGLVRGEPMGRQWFNYMMNYILVRLAGGKTSTDGVAATHIVQSFTTEQPEMLNHGWILIEKKVIAADAANHAAGATVWSYAHTGA